VRGGKNVPKRQFELQVFNPRGKVDSFSVLSPSPRLNNLDGKQIGIIEHRVSSSDLLFPVLEKVLKDRYPSTSFRVWELPLSGGKELREARLNEVAAASDGVIVAIAISGGSTTRMTPDAIKIEKSGKPAAMVVAKCFKSNARFLARSEGLEDLAVAPLILDYVPPAEEIVKLNVAEKLADEIVRALTSWTPQSPEVQEITEDNLIFKGKDYPEAQENMEKFFLQHGWSDGLPLIPPTEEAVNRILEGSQLPRDYVVAKIPPSGSSATIEKVAINAVMAGCLPQYMPVILGALETVIDPRFDLVGVQCTSGQLAPLFLISGPKLIQELNINDSFCTVGPGWRANTTIGRALKMILMNLGYTWPGMNDMKAFGNPFRYVTVIGENEAAYSGAWEPFRVSEGFAYDQPTISVMPAMSWQPDLVIPPATVEKIITRVVTQAKSKYDRFASNCVYNDLLLISPTAFDAIRREGYSRKEIQHELYENIQLPGNEVFDGREGFGFKLLPEWVIEKHKADPEAPVPILLNPESLKICVAGGPGPDMISYIGTWGYGPSYFVTKPIKLPGNWQSLLSKYSGWTSPTIL
jgi:hypothetical protein